MPDAAPLISILTPSFNQAPYLAEALASVRRQQDPAYEHLVFDGGSTDGSVELLRGGGDPHLIWHSGPDRGQAHALNRALKAARGAIIGWINSDDRYAPGAFAAVRAFFARHPEADLVAGGYHEIDPAGRTLRAIRPFDSGAESLVCFWRREAALGQPAIFWRRRLSDVLGGFDETLKYPMDWDYWIRARARGPFHYVNHCLADFRLHWDSHTADDLWAFEQCLNAAEGWLRFLPERQVPAARIELAAQRGELARQRAALDAVFAAVEAWAERTAGPRRLVLYGAGRNCQRLYGRMRAAGWHERIAIQAVDDGGRARSLVPPRTTTWEHLRPFSGAQLVVVTPWCDDPICGRLTAEGLREGPDFIRWANWAELASGQDVAESSAQALECVR